MAFGLLKVGPKSLPELISDHQPVLDLAGSPQIMLTSPAGRGLSAIKVEGGITSQQVFGNPVEFPEAYAWRLLLEKALFRCGLLESSERSLVTAMSGQAFLDHSDCFKSGRLVHEWPWLLKRRLSIRYRRNQHRFVIQVDRNRYKRRHLRRSPELKWLNAKTWRWLHERASSRIQQHCPMASRPRPRCPVPGAGRPKSLVRFGYLNEEPRASRREGAG
ncbi:hypothetical protein MES5069_460023 [Mesorhizobium escarrei]|uniref:Uncharacterized protein n=1 Tax=Mesorhizobium escarrei TaxID=666018 RepID=A0ABN8K6U9_9HYPH|nr:hypothetical protein MES5069_460023 [Mesorhizobium escarrei]